MYELNKKIIEKIINYLNPTDCRNLSRVCHNWRDNYLNSTLYDTEYHSCDLSFDLIKENAINKLKTIDNSDDFEFDLDKQSNYWNTFHMKSKGIFEIIDLGHFFQMRCYILQIFNEILLQHVFYIYLYLLGKFSIRMWLWNW